MNPIPTRNFDRPEFMEYRFLTHVNCDRCGAVETRACVDLDNPEARQERERLAQEQARAKGWRCDETGQRCPACATTCGCHPAVGIYCAEHMRPGDEDLGAGRWARGTEPGVRRVGCGCADGECSCGGGR